jgi:hypothetical protein
MSSVLRCALLLAGFLVVGSGAALSAQVPAAGQLRCDNPELSIELGAYPGPLVSHTGNAVEPVSGRPFFLDFPCGLEPGDEVTFVFNLHGGGSLGNWQRHYFPIHHFKDEYHLIVATPDAGEPGPGTWNPEVDDAYLQGVVNFVYDMFEDQEISFWVAGHSFGGATTRRLICTDFYQARNPVGFLSLSGGRVGNPTPGRGGEPPTIPDCEFSHIYTVGEYEATGQNLPETSMWAAHYRCGSRDRQFDIIDRRPGFVYDSTRQDPGTDSWGRLPRPGVTEWWVYPNCSGGRVVADLVRIDKGHTEGLEENVVEQIVQLMMAAPR